MPATFTVRRYLEKRGMTQAELARESGLSIKTISRLCSNSTGQVSLETLDRIAKVLRVKPGNLIGPGTAW